MNPVSESSDSILELLVPRLFVFAFSVSLDAVACLFPGANVSREWKRISYIKRLLILCHRERRRDLQLKNVRAKVKRMLKRTIKPKRAAAHIQTQFGLTWKLKLFKTATPKLVLLSEACV